MKRFARLLPVLALTVLVTGTGVAAGVGLAGSQSTRPQPVTRLTGYFKVGPSAEYEGDAGGIGGVDPIRVQVPSGTYDAVVTISFDYRTSGDAPFVAGVLVRVGPGLYGKVMKGVPDDVRLRPAPRGASGTGRFLIRGLKGGVYNIEPTVNSGFTDQPNKIVARRVLVTIDLTPTG